MNQADFSSILEQYFLSRSPFKYNQMNNKIVKDMEKDDSIVKILNMEGKSFSNLIQKILEYEKEILFNLDTLYSVRLVQKVARPYPLQEKVALVTQFNEILSDVHEKMRIMAEQLDLSSLYYQTKREAYFVNQNSKDSSSSRNDAKKDLRIEAHKKKIELILNVKLSFFNIRKKYTDTLLQSSLQHYKKLQEIFGLTLPIEVMDADAWLTSSIRKIEKNMDDKTTKCC